MECNFTFKKEARTTDTTYFFFKSFLPINARNLVLFCGFCFIVFYIYGCKLKKIVIRPSRRLEKSTEKSTEKSQKKFTICDSRFAIYGNYRNCWSKCKLLYLCNNLGISML